MSKMKNVVMVQKRRFFDDQWSRVIGANGLMAFLRGTIAIIGVKVKQSLN